MCSHSPYQTTTQNQAEVLDRDTYQRANQGSRKLVKSYVESINANTGQGQHTAVFVYSDGTIERSIGAKG